MRLLDKGSERWSPRWKWQLEVTSSIPVTFTVYLPANQSVANSDFARDPQIGSIWVQ